MGKPLFGHLMQLTDTASTAHGKAGGDLQGTYPNPTINPASLPWTPSGTTLTPTDATKMVSTTTAPTASYLLAPGGTFKSRLQGHQTLGALLTMNRDFANSNAQDDITKPSLSIQLRPDTDWIVFQRAPAGSTAQTSLLLLDNAGNLTINGATATKAAPGTAWVNPSDPRLKRDIAPYRVGLAALQQLQPISFHYNGLGETCDDGTVCHGFDTAAVAPVMPECIRTLRRKLRPDDEHETDIAAMDVSDILLALVNAVKELATRVAALEGKP